MTTKKRASKCTTHHYACDCREYRAQEMEEALQVIHTWAIGHLMGMDTLNADRIIELCKKALDK